MWKPWRRRGVDLSPVQIVDLPERHLASYLVCLEDWSSEMDEAGDHKARWYEQAREQGLRVKLAVDAEDQPLGMIQYVPIELSPAQGEDLYMILCIWVHGYGEGVGDARVGASAPPCSPRPRTMPGRSAPRGWPRGACISRCG